MKKRILKGEQSRRLELPAKETTDFGYRVVDAVLDHFETQAEKHPAASGSRAEMGD